MTAEGASEKNESIEDTTPVTSHPLAFLFVSFHFFFFFFEHIYIPLQPKQHDRVGVGCCHVIFCPHAIYLFIYLFFLFKGCSAPLHQP